MEDEIFVCNKCGGNNIHTLAWVDYNTLQFIELKDEELHSESIFCVNCNDYITVIEKSLYEEEVKTKAEIIGDAYMNKADEEYERRLDK